MPALFPVEPVTTQDLAALLVAARDGKAAPLPTMARVRLAAPHPFARKGMPC